MSGSQFFYSLNSMGKNQRVIFSFYCAKFYARALNLQRTSNRFMETKRILIIDEKRFSRICSALLSAEGHQVQSVTTSDARWVLNSLDVDLIVASYPYGAPVFDDVRKRNTPVLILADNFDENLIRMLNDFESSSCMVKPLDYTKFKSLVKDLMSSELTMTEGYTII